VVLSPLDLPDWDDVQIIGIIEQEFDLPAYLENDTDAGVLQVHQDGAAEVGKSQNLSRFTGYGLDTHFHLSTEVRITRTPVGAIPWGFAPPSAGFVPQDAGSPTLGTRQKAKAPGVIPGLLGINQEVPFGYLSRIDTDFIKRST